jgi:hypothetical protein
MILYLRFRMVLLSSKAPVEEMLLISIRIN